LISIETKNRLQEIARITGVVFHFDDPKFIWPYVPRSASRCLTKTFEKMGLNLERLDYIPDIDFNEYLIWTFVRNPFTKVVSALNYFSQTWDMFLEKHDQYIEEGMGKDPRRVGKHLLPSSFFTHNGKRFVGYIGRFENLHDDWEGLLNILHIPFKELLPNKWKVKSSLNLDKRAIPIIQDMYKDDFELLGYDPNIFQ